MQIGEVIRKYRKDKNMTQEELAVRLGVTTPAVNKWEKGNSYPDIMLLAPIARLLDISLDTLLSFQAELRLRTVYSAGIKDMMSMIRRKNVYFIFRPIIRIRNERKP